MDSPPSDDGYVSAVELCDPRWWAGAVAAYSSWLGTRHAAPGAACCLQHYCGKVLPLVVAEWVRTGRLLSMRHEDWQVRVDENAATTAARHTAARHTAGHTAAGYTASGTPAGVPAVGQAVADHVAPLLDGVLAASNLTRATALGGPAASLGGAVARLYAAADPADRAGIVRDGAAIIAVLEQTAGRALIRLDADGDVLLQTRTTCCLIRLGTERSFCDTCPRMDPIERVRRQRARTRRAHP